MKLINALEEFLENYESHLPKEDVEAICKSFFTFAKDKMREYKFIRFRYLGALVIFPGRAKDILERNKRAFIQNRKTEEEYLKAEKEITNLLKEIDHDNNDECEDAIEG